MSQDNRPHVIIASTAFAPFLGGAEVAVQEIIKQLQHEFRFTIITARMDATLPSRDTWFDSRVMRVGWGSAFDKLLLIIALPLLAWKLRRSDKACMVWAIMASYAGAGAFLAHTLVRMPYVLTLQEGDNLAQVEKMVGFGMPLFKKIFSHAQGIHAIAPFLSDWARKLGARVQPIVVPNGVTPEQFTISDTERCVWRTQIRKEYGIPSDASVIFTVSRLVSKNGVADLIDTVIAHPTWHVVIVGDGKLREELRERARIAENRIHFVGTRGQEDLRRFAAAADVFCRPALSEGQGIVFLEAMCMGLPIVATNVGGIPTIITHGEHGLLVPPSHPEELSAALQLVFTDRNLYERLQKNGYTHAREFAWSVLAPRIGEWLKKHTSHVAPLFDRLQKY